MRSAPICQAPQYASEELLRSEGFSDVQEVKKEGNITARIQALTSGEGDIVSTYVAPLITRIDAGDPIVILTGLHAGCFELFGTDRIRAIRDLKGKTVTVTEMGGAAHLHLASILSYVGLNPGKDVQLCHTSSSRRDTAAGRRQDRRLHGLSTGPAGIAGEEDWPRNTQQRAGSALVAVFLLYGGGEP